MFRCLTALLLLTLFPPVLAADTTLKIATLAPDGTSWMKRMRQAADEIRHKSAGRVALRFYPGGVMGNDNSVLRKIRVGQLQGGAITGGGLSSLYPDAQIYTLPFQFRNLGEVDAVRAVLDRQIIEGLRKAGFVSFGLSEGGFAYLLSNTPVRTIEDMKGLKIWIPEGDEVNAKMFKALGISPIPLPLTDVMTGLQTGLIDTIASSPVGAIALQWHSRVKYLTDVPLAYLYGTLVIRSKALERLEARDRKVVHESLHAAFSDLDRQSRTGNLQALEALKQQGIEFIKPSPADRDALEIRADKVLAELASEGFFSRQLFERMQQLIRQQRNGEAAH